MRHAVGEYSFSIEGSSSRGHVCLSHYKAHVAPIYDVVPIPDVDPDVVEPDSFWETPKTFHYFFYMHIILLDTRRRKR